VLDFGCLGYTAGGTNQRCADAEILASASGDFASASAGISRQASASAVSVNGVMGTNVKYSANQIVRYRSMVRAAWQILQPVLNIIL